MNLSPYLYKDIALPSYDKGIASMKEPHRGFNTTNRCNHTQLVRHVL